MSDDLRRREIEDEARLRELLEALVRDLDSADGAAAARRLTDPAVVDLRAYDPHAGPPKPLSPAEIAAYWEAYLYAFDALEHRLSAPRFTVSADAALGVAHLRLQLVSGAARLLVHADLVTRFKRVGSHWYLERFELDILREDGDPSARP